MDLGLENKVVVVTGVNNPAGIGAAAALAFAREGAKLALVYKRMEMPFNPAKTAEYGMDWYMQKVGESAEAVETCIRAVNAPYVVLEKDISDENDVTDIFDETEAALGPVDILINNAAVYCDEDNIMMFTKSDLDSVYAVNINGTSFMMREFVWRYHERQGQSGRIINLSTDAAEFLASQIVFGSSKAAIEALTRAAALEIAHLGITVNAIAPGPVQTGWLDQASERAILSSIPAGRVGTPEDVTNAMLFLASDKASWITGQVLKVAGGHAV